MLGLLLALPAALAGGLPVAHGVVRVTPPLVVPVDAQPLLVAEAPDRPAAFHLSCTLEGGHFDLDSGVVPQGQVATFPLPVLPPIATASCVIVGSFANGTVERLPLELAWTWLEPPPPPVDGEEAAPEPPAPEPPAPAGTQGEAGTP